MSNRGCRIKITPQGYWYDGEILSFRIDNDEGYYYFDAYEIIDEIEAMSYASNNDQGVHRLSGELGRKPVPGLLSRWTDEIIDKVDIAFYEQKEVDLE